MDTAKMRFQQLPQFLSAAAGYFVLAQAGFLTQIPGTGACPIWLPAGLAVFLISRWGVPAILGVFLGATLINWTGGFYTFQGIIWNPGTLSIPVAIGNGAGNTVEAMLIASFVRERNGTTFLMLGQTIAVLCFAAAVSASVGIGLRLWEGLFDWKIAASAWPTWWMGDIAGAGLGVGLLYEKGRVPMLSMSLPLAGIVALTLLQAPQQLMLAAEFLLCALAGLGGLAWVMSTELAAAEAAHAVEKERRIEAEKKNKLLRDISFERIKMLLEMEDTDHA
jgi:hypothetical protein